MVPKDMLCCIYCPLSVRIDITYFCQKVKHEKIAQPCMGITKYRLQKGLKNICVEKMLTEVYFEPKN